MSLLTKNFPPLILIALCGVLSIVSHPHLSTRIPVHWGADGNVSTYAHRDIAVYLNPAGAAVVFVFFSLIPHIDKGRVRQLRRIGLFEPLRNIAIFGFGYAHFLGIGIGLGVLPRQANFVGGVAALLLILLGTEIRQPRCGLFSFTHRLAPQFRKRISAISISSGGFGLALAAGGEPYYVWAVAWTATALWAVLTIRRNLAS